MKVRSLLRQHSIPQRFKGSPLIAQFSSLGSLSSNWLEEFCASLLAPSTGGVSPLSGDNVATCTLGFLRVLSCLLLLSDG